MGYLKRHRMLIFIIISTMIVFAVWMGILWLIHTGLAGTTNAQGDFWAMTEALSTALAAATVVGTVFFAYRELSEVASSRHLEVADKLFQELNSPENIEARRWVFRYMPDDPQVFIDEYDMDEEGQAAIKQVLNSLDHVAFLTQQGWIPDDVIMPWMHPMIAKSWQRLEPYVLFERARRGESYYYKFAEGLARRCDVWRRKNLPASEHEITWIDDAL
mgnify:CR=1 FL=1